MIVSRRFLGYFLGIVAAGTYGLNPLFALPLMKGGMDTMPILFWRYLLAIPIVAVMMLIGSKPFKIDRKELQLLVCAGLLMGVSSVSLFESYRYMSAGIASTMLFVYPLMVALIGIIFFKEKLGIITWISLAGALFGISLLYKGEDGATLSAVGTIFVMISSLSYAIYIVGINRTRLCRVPTLTVTFYVLLFGLSIFIACLLWRGGFSIPHDWFQWGCVGSLAFFPTALSFVCTTLSIVYIGSTPTAILGAFEPVTAVIIGIAVFGEHITGRAFTGILLIVVAVLLVIGGGNIGRYLTNVRLLFGRIRLKKVAGLQGTRHKKPNR